MLIQPETSRLWLRQWREDDREPFAKLNANPKVMEFFLSTLDREASDAMLNRCQQLIEQKGWGFWAVELKETKQLIGFVGLHQPIAELPFAPCVEIGWRLDTPFWGKGFATEAAQMALKVGFEQLALSEIVSFTTLQNKRSQAVMQRLGMAYAEQFDHPAVPEGSPLKKHCLYRLSKLHWLNLVK